MDTGVMKILNEEREQSRQELEFWINAALALAQECQQWDDASRKFGTQVYEKFADEWRKRRGYSLKPGERINPSWEEMFDDYVNGLPRGGRIGRRK